MSRIFLLVTLVFFLGVQGANQPKVTSQWSVAKNDTSGCQTAFLPCPGTMMNLQSGANDTLWYITSRWDESSGSGIALDVWQRNDNSGNSEFLYSKSPPADLPTVPRVLGASSSGLLVTVDPFPLLSFEQRDPNNPNQVIQTVGFPSNPSAPDGCNMMIQTRNNPSRNTVMILGATIGNNGRNVCIGEFDFDSFTFLSAWVFPTNPRATVLANSAVDWAYTLLYISSLTVDVSGNNQTCK